MRQLVLLVFAFAISTPSFAFVDYLMPDGHADFHPSMHPQTDRDVAYDMLPQAQWGCIRAADEAGLQLFSNIEITPTKLPANVERFRLVVTVCDDKGTCRANHMTEFSQAHLNRIVSQVWAIEYGCKVKAGRKIDNIQFELIGRTEWYKRDMSLDVGFFRVSALAIGSTKLTTRTGKAEFSIEVKRQ